MNCKPGDLAIVVVGGNAGMILTCLRLKWLRVRMPDESVQVMPAWQTDRELKSWSGDSDNFIEDELLRPIRDPGDDAVDETLLRLPSPRQEVTA